MRPRLIASLAALAAVVALHACGGSTLDEGDSESHFLEHCTGTCFSGLECLCGVCTLPCDSDQLCDRFGAGVTCISDPGCAASTGTCGVATTPAGTADAATDALSDVAEQTCADGVRNGDETDVDCGGTNCAACAPGTLCRVATDCTSSLCTGGLCQSPSCGDGVLNGTETGVDCGGACVPCGGHIESGCTQGTDCVEGVCISGVCQHNVCTDGVKDGYETDVDCGGWICPTCSIGDACVLGTDCVSGTCISGFCETSLIVVDDGGSQLHCNCAPSDLMCAMRCAAACTNGIQDGTETDVDCGGETCSGCAPALSCALDTDCQTGVCAGGLCATASCSDHVKNGDESDVDCGGSTCPACPTGSACTQSGDCQSGVCSNGVCALN